MAPLVDLLEKSNEAGVRAEFPRKAGESIKTVLADGAGPHSGDEKTKEKVEKKLLPLGECLRLFFTGLCLAGRSMEGE